MFLTKIFENKNLHHAYLLVGQPATILSEVEKIIKEKLKTVDLSSNPDYWQEKFSTFGIKESLDLRGRQNKRAFGELGRYFVLTIDSITVEAQNALLKTFEEPASDNHFFIIVRSEDIFLPTLKSRFEIIKNITAEVSLSETLAVPLVSKFLKLEPQARLEFVQKEFIKNKDIGKGEVFDFLNELERVLRDKVKKISEAGKDLIFALSEIEKARNYLSNPRSSVRLILEHIALIV